MRVLQKIIETISSVDSGVGVVVTLKLANLAHLKHLKKTL